MGPLLLIFVILPFHWFCECLVESWRNNNHSKIYQIENAISFYFTDISVEPDPVASLDSALIQSISPCWALSFASSCIFTSRPKFHACLVRLKSAPLCANVRLYL